MNRLFIFKRESGVEKIINKEVLRKIYVLRRLSIFTRVSSENLLLYFTYLQLRASLLTFMVWVDFEFRNLITDKLNYQ